MKYQVDTLDGIDEGVQGLYEKGDNGYTLKVEGLDVAGVEEVSALRNALEGVREKSRTRQEKLEELQEATKKAEREAAKKSGDAEAIETSLRGHFEPIIAERDTIIGRQKDKLHQLLVLDASKTIAGRIAVDSDSADILSEIIKKRLSVQDSDGDFKTVVLDGEGKQTGLTLAEYQSELLGNKSLARLLKATDGAGSGATKPGAGGSKINSGMGGDKKSRIATINARLEQAN